MFVLVKRAERPGMRIRPSILCKYRTHSRLIMADRSHIRRTYSDEDQGEMIREGFEPTAGEAAGVSEFAIGDDEDEATGSEEGEEESKAKSRQRGCRGENGKTERTASNYGTLDDQHVWANDGS